MVWQFSPFLELKRQCSGTSLTQTLMAHSPGLARTIIMVPLGHFMHNPSWMAGATLSKNNFYGSKPVQAIEVLLLIVSDLIGED